MRRRPIESRFSQGFTLIEVLVVVAIIALLITILAPSLAKARAQAQRTICLNNQKQLAQAHYFYHYDHKGLLPGEDLWLAARKSLGDQDTFDDAPQSGQLFGNQPTAYAPNRRKTRQYINDETLYLCPMDLKGLDVADRRPNVEQAISQNFSYPRNSEPMEALGPRWTKDGTLYEERYLQIEKVKFASATPLLVEERENSAMNDGEIMARSTLDYLTQRHNGRAVLSYHDMHAEPVICEWYNHGTLDYRRTFLAPGLY